MSEKKTPTLICPNCGEDLLPSEQCPECGWTPYATMDPMGAIRGVGRASRAGGRDTIGRAMLWVMSFVFLVIALANLAPLAAGILREPGSAPSILRSIDPMSALWLLISVYVVYAFVRDIASARRRRIRKKGRGS